MFGRRSKPQQTQFYTQQNIPCFRQFASKVEEEISIQAKNNKMQDSNAQSQKSIDLYKKIDELIYENQIKKKALDKASKMINLLGQQRQQLMSQLQMLKISINQKQQIISTLKQNINKLQTKNEQLVEQFYKKNQSAIKQVTTSNSLFFSFTQPKSIKTTSTKVIHPSTIQIKHGITVSQQFSPWPVHSELIQTLAEAMSQEQNQNFQIFQMNNIFKKEQQQIQQQKQKLVSKQQEVYDELLIESDQDSIILSSGKLTTQISQSNLQSTQQILSQYQKIISDFRQYSSLLKAYLCETINAIAKIGSIFNYQHSLNPNQILEFISKTVQQFLQNQQCNSKAYINQNQQLKQIVNQMIQNFSLIKKIQRQRQNK